MYVTDDIRVQRGHYTRLWLYWFTRKHAPVRLAGNDTVPISVRRGGGIGNESVPIQSAQCWFPGLAISSAKIQIYFSNKIYGSNFVKQHSETVTV